MTQETGESRPSQSPDPDIGALIDLTPAVVAQVADRVYEIIRRELKIERERAGRRRLGADIK